MQKIFKKAFQITKGNFLLTNTLLLIYIMTVVLAVVIVTKFQANIMLGLVAILSVLLLSIALISGWLNMIKGVIDVEKQDSKNDFIFAAIMPNFFPGVAKYFSVNTIIMAIYFVIFGITFYLSYKGLTLLHPAFKMTMEGLRSVLELSKNMNYTELMQTKYLIPMFWLTLGNVLQWVISYFTMFTLAAAVFFQDTKEKPLNPFTALADSFKLVFKNFWDIFVIFIVLTALSIIISAVIMPLSLNFILSMIGMILLCFYATFYVIVVFLYYDEKQNKSNSDIGSDSVGEEPDSD